MTNFINWFREAIPYIKQHKNQIFVVLISDINQSNAKQTLYDISHLHTLGIKIVLIHGSRSQINQCLENNGIKNSVHNNFRITDEASMECIKQSNALIKLEIEAILSKNSTHKTISGNFITAQPLGIIDGIDYQKTGKIRKVDTKAIGNLLTNNIVILSPLGFAANGEIFNLNAEQLASFTASTLSAKKLIILHNNPDLTDSNGKVISEITTQEINKLQVSSDWQRCLNSASKACTDGVDRVHILNSNINGVLLQELFSPAGQGTMVTISPYEQMRPAKVADALSILSIITPLIDQGILIHRSIESITQNINTYYVLERDAKIIGIAALLSYQEPHIGEVACVAIDYDYRSHQRGKKLLAYVESIAKSKNMTQLFVMSTQTSHWFIEQGYHPIDLSDLPIDKQKLYNTDRNSLPYLKNI